MALKVWLPLNKDLRNVGLEDVKAEKNGSSVVFQTDTSFNKVLYFGTTNANGSVYFPPEKFTGYTAMSVSFYVNFLTFDADYSNLVGFFNSATASDIYNANKIFSFYKNVNTTGTTAQFNFYVNVGSSNLLTNSFGTNTWQHFVLVNDNKKIILYQNGIKIGGVTLSSNIPYSGIKRVSFGQSNNTDNTRHCNAKMCDLRIYDHALSDEDVKRIYQQKMFELVPYSGVKDVLFDRSGLMNMPLVNNGADFQTNCLYFDGINDQLRPKVTNDGFNISGGTLSIWFEIASKPTKVTIVYMDEKSNMCLAFNNYGNTLYVKSSAKDSTSYPCYSINDINFGQINNVIVTYKNYVHQTVLVNGVVPSTSLSSTGLAEPAGAGLTIGGRQYNITSRFDGKIYKVAVYKKQFTQDEAVELYNSERGMFLPDDYIQLEYIEGTGTQWIDSGVKANQDTVVEIEFEITGNETGYGAVFGARTNSSSNCFNVWTKCGNGKIGCQVGNSGSKNCNTAQAANVIYKLKISNGNITVNGDSANFTPVSDFETPLNVRIFNIANGDTSSSGTGNRILIGKVYSFKVYNSGMIVRNMFPSKHKSDNVIGMYDMVSMQFFTNSGTGSFTGA